MTISILAKPFSWSFSRVKNFETCPRRYHEIDVLKNFREAKSPELQVGFAVHEAMAKRLTDGTPLPANMPFEHWIEWVANEGGKITVEEEIAITSEFKPCAYFDKVKPVWLRAKIDVLRLNGRDAHIIDWKTGKVKPDMTQLKLAALCVMVHHPHIFNITADLVWLGDNTRTTEKFTVDELVDWWVHGMTKRVTVLQKSHDENHFPPSPSGLCGRWCVVTSCEYCGQSSQ